MPMVPASIRATCIHGPIQVPETAKVGTRIDKKTGEEKADYKPTGKMLNQWTFMVGATSVDLKRPDPKAFQVGKVYEFTSEIFLKFLDMTLNGEKTTCVEVKP